MVRAVKLETGASGTYFNASQGAFDFMLTVSIDPEVTQEETNSGTTYFLFNVTLSTSFGQTVTVAYDTAQSLSGDPAEPGTDYSATSGVLTFAATEIVKMITLQVFGDTDDEEDETFQVILSNPQGSDILALGVSDSLGTILDDD
jgi:chitinase